MALAGEAIAIVGINVNDERANADAMVAELGLGYTMLADTELLAAQAYQVRGLPTVVLVDAQGRIRYQDHQLPERSAINAALP